MEPRDPQTIYDPSACLVEGRREEINSLVSRCLSVRPSVRLSVSLCVSLSLCLSVCLPYLPIISTVTGHSLIQLEHSPHYYAAVKEALSVLMLCAPVFLFTLWSIDLTVATSHIQ